MPRNRTRRPAGVLTNETLSTLVGASFIHRIDDREHAPLRIGSQRWTTNELAFRLGVVHTKAARLLTAAADSINAKSVRDLYHRSSPYTFSGLKGLGETTMYVLWRLFEAEGLDPEKWATAGTRDDALVSFRSLKLREQHAEKRTQAGVSKRSTGNAKPDAADRR